MLRWLLSQTCSHMRGVPLDYYPDGEWVDAGDDSKIFFCRGHIKMRCAKCGTIYLQAREFIHKNKLTGQLSS